MTRHTGSLFVFTRDAVRALDERAAKDYGIPSLLLMENAARHVADTALDGLEALETPRVVIVCGVGNNGGDGMAVARHLHNAAVRVAIVLTEDGLALKGDAPTQRRIVERMGLPIFVAGKDPGEAMERAADALGGCDLIIDALLGTGTMRPVEGVVAALIDEVNESARQGVDVLSIDIPSGLDADTGEAWGDAVHASVTVTLAGIKQGFLSLEAQAYVGEVFVADIGVPLELLRSLGTPLSGRGADPDDEAAAGSVKRTPEGVKPRAKARANGVRRRPGREDRV